MRISQYMSAKVLTATPDDGLRETFFRMREARMHHLPVLADGQLVGVISARDLRRPDGVDEARELVHQYRLDDDLHVEDVMSANPVVVHTYDSIGKAAQLLAEGRSGALPVLDKTQALVGVLSTVDLARAFCDLLQEQRGAK